MVLQGEGGEEAGEAGYEAAQDRRQPDGLPPAVGDRQGGEHQRHREGETAQQPCTDRHVTSHTYLGWEMNNFQM